MDEAAITKYICETFGGVDVVDATGGAFYFYDSGKDIPKDHRFPFATLVTSDEYDQFSNLSRQGVSRLNVGVGKETFQSLFDPTEAYDFTALDRVMPHPVYGKMYWVCVLNPSDATFEAVKPLLAEAYETAARRHTKQGKPGEPEPPQPDGHGRAGDLQVP
jgi:hypothetical protein